MLKKIFSSISEEIEKTFDLDRARNYLEARRSEQNTHVGKDDCLEISYISTFDVFQFLEQAPIVSVN
jgi:hypothetical protein